MLKGIFLSSSISMYGLEDGIFLDTQGTYYNFLSFIRDNIFTVADKEIFFKTGGGIFILCAIGLYLINKKLKEPNPWISFIPILQIWSYFQASKKPFLTYFVYPFIGMTIGFLLPGIMMGLNLSLKIVPILSIIVAIYTFICRVCVLNAISIRLKRGIGTTILLILFLPIMLIYLGVVMEDKSKNA